MFFVRGSEFDDGGGLLEDTGRAKKAARIVICGGMQLRVAQQRAPEVRAH
jgi:hypothetical protein